MQDSGEEKGLSLITKDRAIKLARNLEDNYSEKNIDKIEKKKDKYFTKEAFLKIRDKAEYLWTKLKAHETPWQMKLAIFGGFAYMLLPVDVIPDAIPFFGCQCSSGNLENFISLQKRSYKRDY